MRLHEVGLLVGLGLLLSLSQLLDQTHRFALETTVEPTAGTGVDNITKLVGGEVQESERENIGLALMIPFEFSVCVSGKGVLVEVDATVGKLAEGSLLLDLRGLNGVLL